MPHVQTFPSRSRVLLAAIAAFTLVLLPLLPAGCEKPSPPAPVTTQPAATRIETTGRPQDQEQSRPVATVAVSDEPATIQPIAEPEDGGQVVEDVWDAYSIQGSRVGYAHTTVANEAAGQPMVRTRSVMRTVLKRAGQTVTQDLMLTSRESPAGQVLTFESQMTTGNSIMFSSGQVNGDKLTIETRSVGKTQTRTIDWPPGTGGFFAVEQSLKKQPLAAGEKRSVKAIMPIFNTIGVTNLAAGDYETVELPGGSQKLLRVESELEIGGQKLQSTLWIDEQGQTLKSLVPSIGQEAVRTTRADAIRQPAGKEFDLLAASIVKLPTSLPSPQQTKKVVYRARLKKGSIAGTFPSGQSQSVRALDDGSVELTVLRVRPKEPLPVAHQSKPTADDLAANVMIQCDDPRIVEMAAKAAPADADPWTVAVALEKHVATSIKKKNFSQAFATASEVAQSLEGDCTEHAMLLAALCRARKIPAQVSYGLVYCPPAQGFAYHMWNEVWIEDRWIPLDGTLGLGGVAADRISLGSSSFSEATELSALLPVVSLFGQLELEVVYVE